MQASIFQTASGELLGWRILEWTISGPSNLIFLSLSVFSSDSQDTVLAVQSVTRAQLFATPWTAAGVCPPLLPRVCSSSCEMVR